MENIIFKSLIGLKINGEWYNVTNQSEIYTQPTTVENIRNLINNNYSSLGVVTTHETENEIFVITNKPINLTNI